MDEKIHHQSVSDSFQYNLNAYNGVLYQELIDNCLFEKEVNTDYFTVILFEKADGTHTIDLVEFPLKEFQMHLVFPGQIHQCNYENCIKAYRFVVSRQILDTFGNYLMFPFSFYMKHPSFKLSSEIFYRILYEFQNIYHELQHNENIWEIVLPRIRILTLMISKEACRLFFIDDENAATKKLAEFFKLVILHFRAEKNVKFYADKMSLSPNYLNIICKRYFNKTASSIINNELILEIKTLLINSNKSIKEIAFDLGFKDLSGFSVFFSNNTGMSPRDFLLKYHKSKIG
ncbi:AraC family transcriptional regulator [Chryseobacterium lactis]|uniref:AraC family transcriptional regulator n=1 Tax=Chryseobacterium lactis TaxID=1241981 RepID=A0A3G6RMC1_CHRLC|nr:helix-turn-helix domain-containing protein [Chryseobacterium lactis]AZA82625.1 AraC family transcriptional regulator [Chryseobacterium lactis]AZB03006.1 AraC family transcriptional regulator [Chryseobacterium lactis]PNW11854.1 AraC family transcriptional regulator [Chryseobacterium lactis]